MLFHILCWILRFVVFISFCYLFFIHFYSFQYFPLILEFFFILLFTFYVSYMSFYKFKSYILSMILIDFPSTSMPIFKFRAFSSSRPNPLRKHGHFWPMESSRGPDPDGFMTILNVICYYWYETPIYRILYIRSYI